MGRGSQAPLGRGPPGGTPGGPGGPGGPGCTFSRVFNNSPSRDRCWLFREERVVSGGPNFGPRGPAGPARGARGPPRGAPRGPPPRGSKKGVFLTLPETPEMDQF